MRFDIEAPPEDPETADVYRQIAAAIGGAEGITDPIVPPRAPLAITGSVGRGGRNGAADVRAVQDRLVELRALQPSDATAEQPSGAAAVAEATLSQTIAAIETVQRQVGLTADGKVDVSGATRTALDRSIPAPTPAEFAAVTTARGRITQVVSRGLTLAGPVGAVAAGNAADDVRAVQRRLVEVGALSATHRETPAAGASAAIPQGNLQATISALRTFQRDVRFWVARGTVAGHITPGVAAPGDATAALLDRISVYDMRAATERIALRDHVRSAVTRSDMGVMFAGTARPAAIPLADYSAMGLTAGQAAALKFVSTHEGNFDAINTYDRALVSVGFIQFAGGRGLPPYLALLKARHPSKFRAHLQTLGIDVEFTVVRGAIEAAQVVVLDAARAAVLRAEAAETAIRDDKVLTTALIVSGRDRDVQLTQIEAAARYYVLPALDAVVSWAAGPARARLGDLLRSQKGMAMLFDRTIQEGLAAARRRLERIVQRVARSAGATPPPTLAELQGREGDVLAEVERDLQAATDVAARITRARDALEVLGRAARTGGAPLASVLARPELADARRAVTDARTGLATVVNVTPTGGRSVDATLASMTTTLTGEESRLTLVPPPPSIAVLATALAQSREALAAAAGPVSMAAAFLGRIQRVRRSTLDSSLAETA